MEKIVFIYTNFIFCCTDIWETAKRYKAFLCGEQKVYVSIIIIKNTHKTLINLL